MPPKRPLRVIVGGKDSPGEIDSRSLASRRLLAAKKTRSALSGRENPADEADRDIFELLTIEPTSPRNNVLPLGKGHGRTPDETLGTQVLQEIEDSGVERVELLREILDELDNQGD